MVAGTLLYGAYVLRFKRVNLKYLFQGYLIGFGSGLGRQFLAVVQPQQ
jgi:hypothetical protein